MHFTSKRNNAATCFIRSELFSNDHFSGVDRSAREILLIVELLIVDGGVDLTSTEEAPVERLLALLHLLVRLELHKDLDVDLGVGCLALPLLVDDHLHHLAGTQ